MIFADLVAGDAVFADVNYYSINLALFPSYSPQ